jgi:hypothetical protein
MLLLVLSTACAGLFCGAALYINLVEHPARVSAGTGTALREFAPSYRRASVLQGSLAFAGSGVGLAAAWRLGDSAAAFAAALLGAAIPYTLIVLFPTNKQLLDPALDAHSARAAALLSRWNRLHAVRTALGAGAFLLLVWRVAADAARAALASGRAL